MNTIEPQDEIPQRPFNLIAAVIIIVAIFALLALLIGFLAFRAYQQNAADVLWVPDDYATIQAAIDAANPGGIIQVRAGVYNENLTLNKAVSLVAETFDPVNPANNQTVIDGGGGAVTILIPPGMIQMPIIRGFVIRNSMDGIQASSEFIAEFNFFHSATNLVSYQKGGGGFNRNNIYFLANGNAIRMDNTDRPILIENNRIMYSGESGIEISLQNIDIPPALIEIQILNNMILGNKEDGIQLVACNLRTAVYKGKNHEAREAMSLAALYGGMALANARLGAVHGFAAPIGGIRSAPHGAVCARLLPVVMECNIKALQERQPGSQYLERYRMIARICTGDEQTEAEAAVDWIYNLREELGIPPLSSYGVTSGDSMELVAKAAQASSMKGNPIQLTTQELELILERSL